MILTATLRSSALAAASYDTETETLTLDWQSGATADHDGVPQDVYEQLVASASPGRFYHAQIKDVY